MPEVREAENSEALVHDEGETVRLEWTVHGTRRTVLVAEEIVEQYVASENSRRAAERLALRLFCDDKPADSTLAALNEWAKALPERERGALASILGESDLWTFAKPAEQEAQGA